MTSRQVVFSPQALRDIAAQFDWWRIHRSALQAERWLNRVFDCTDGLSQSAEGHSLSFESEELGMELRDCLIGLSSRPTHRVVFEIRGDIIYLLAVRSVHQGHLTADDLLL